MNFRTTIILALLAFDPLAEDLLLPVTEEILGKLVEKSNVAVNVHAQHDTVGILDELSAFLSRQP